MAKNKDRPRKQIQVRSMKNIEKAVQEIRHTRLSAPRLWRPLILGPGFIYKDDWNHEVRKDKRTPWDAL
jgi:hypothetical protein